LERERTVRRRLTWRLAGRNTFSMRRNRSTAASAAPDTRGLPDDLAQRTFDDAFNQIGDD